MKNLLKLKGLLYAIPFVSLFIFTYACSSEQIAPNSGRQNQDLKIISRDGGDCTQCAEWVKNKVSEEYQIPLERILTCVYYGPATSGGCEYHLTYTYSGPPVYIKGIIGDDAEGC